MPLRLFLIILILVEKGSLRFYTGYQPATSFKLFLSNEFVYVLNGLIQRAHFAVEDIG